MLQLLCVYQGIHRLMHYLLPATAPEDIGNQLAYLLGPRAQFITNAVVAIDGGWI